MVPSPCIKKCILDKGEVCTGCFRTLFEIVKWSYYSDEEKQSVLDRIQKSKEE